MFEERKYTKNGQLWTFIVNYPEVVEWTKYVLERSYT